MKLKWITKGQYTRSAEGRFTIVVYSYDHISAGLRATINTDPAKLEDRVRDASYSFQSLAKAKAFCQDRLNKELA